MKRRAIHRRGLMLVEMLIVIGILAAFILVAGKLFTTTLRMTQTSHESSADVAAYESFARVIRRDAWGAAEVSALPQGGIAIKRGDGVVINWLADDGGAVVRRTGDNREPELRWPGLGGKVRLVADPAGVVVRSGDAGSRFASQLKLAGRGPA